MAQFVSDCLRTMRLIIGRRNENDPDSSDTTLRQYINDFVTMSMSDDVKLFEQFGTLTFTIDETNETGVYTFNDVGADSNFVNISIEGFITLSVPPAGSISWNKLEIYQDPYRFYRYWGIDNTDILIPGYPTDMLYYGDEIVFRTIPDTSYDVTIYGYKENEGFGDDGNPQLPFDYWMRYISYGAALNYAMDYRYEGSVLNQIKEKYAHERKLLLTRTYNQAKLNRCIPKF